MLFGETVGVTYLVEQGSWAPNIHAPSSSVRVRRMRSRLRFLGMAFHVELLMMCRTRERTEAGSNRIVAARLDLHIIRRVRVHQLNCFHLQQPVHVRHAGAVAAQEAMPTEDPQVAGLGDRLVGRRGDFVRVGEP